MKIRAEIPADQEAVSCVIDEAFGGPDESRLVEALRRDGDAVCSVVAHRDDEILGQVMFSKMTTPFVALALAPVSVAPCR